jgi:hypothetical protein
MDSSFFLESWTQLEMRLKIEVFGNFFFIHPAFVDHLHCDCRADSNKQSAVGAAATEIQTTFGQNGFLHLSPPILLYDALTVSESFSKLALQMGTLGFHTTIRIHLATDSEHWN